MARRRILGLSLVAMCSIARAGDLGPDEISVARAQVALTNLISGLYLTGGQGRRLHCLLVEWERERHRHQGAVAALAASSGPDLDRVRARIAAREPVDECLAQRVCVAEELATTLEERHEATVAGLVRRLRDALTPTQVDLVVAFEPCLLPPDTQTNPARIGEIRPDGGEVERRLRELWAAPSGDLPRLVDGWAAEIGRRDRSDPPPPGNSRETLAGVARYVRTLTALELEVQVEPLARSLMVSLRMEATRPDAVQAIRDHLLIPGAAAVVGEWLQACEAATGARRAGDAGARHHDLASLSSEECAAQGCATGVTGRPDQAHVPAALAR